MEVNRIMLSELKGHIDIKNHFSMDTKFDVQMLSADFNDLMRAEDFKGDFTRGLIQSDIALEKAKIVARDYGLFDKLVNINTKNLGQSAVTTLDVIQLKID